VLTALQFREVSPISGCLLGAEELAVRGRVRRTGSGCKPTECYICAARRYRTFRYEQLKDIKTYVQAGDWLVSSDMRSGYHMIPMAESAFKYLVG